MIYDKVENCLNYKGINKNLDKALEKLYEMNFSKVDYPNKKEPKIIIDTDKIFINIMEYETSTQTDNIFELHNNYFDIHYIIDGEEDFFFSDDKSKITEKNDENDYELYDCIKSSNILLNNKYFCICFPKELHKPKNSYKNESKVEKAVFKVLY